MKRRRYGTHEVKTGKYKGSLHVVSKNYHTFHSELIFLSDYLHRRIIPTEHEETYMREIILDLQNILENEIEHVIRAQVKENPSEKSENFLKKIEEGFASFKSKFEWLRTKHLISTKEAEILEQIRLIRNSFTHSKPKLKRKKLKYFNKPLMTKNSMRKIFLQVDAILNNLRQITKRKSKWCTTPPGYIEEMNWPTIDKL